MKTTILTFVSEADDYSQNTINDTEFRVLIVSRVVVGKPYERLRNDTSLTKPPSGFHSVRS